MFDRFNLLYQKLNTAQKEAVDTVEGPVMVVAGPGTGKTQILTLRIANILKQTQIEPENILALTFTEYAASSMRRRLAEIIGSPAYRVRISTFHGFCNDIIKNYPEEFPHIIGSTNITEPDQIRIMEGLLATLPLVELKPFGDPLYYLRSILISINQLKREGVTPERFFKIVEDERRGFEGIDDLYYEKGPHKGKMKGDYQKQLKTITKNAELAIAYEAYQQKLTEEKRYDYNDMIVEVMRALSINDNLLLMLQEQHQYVLVDEHQDTNNSQNKILELLCNFHADPNIFVVGDEKQAIFRFQGASLENFLYFKKLYPGARLVVLDNNYRSVQSILDAAESLIPGQKKLQSNSDDRGGEGKIRLASFPAPEIENYFIARDIQQAIADGVPAHEIAVLYRDNRDAFGIAAMFEKIGVPFVIQSDQNILQDKDIKKLIMLIDAVNDPLSEEKLVDVLHIDFLGIVPLDVYMVLRAALRERRPIHELISSDHYLDTLHLEAPERVKTFSRNFSAWIRSSHNDNLTEFFEKIINESGYIEHILKSGEQIESLEKLNLFYDELRQFIESHRDARLRDFCDYLTLLRQHNILIKKTASHSGHAVRLMTAHKSKGLEFDRVYIANAYDGHWGNCRRAEPIQLLPAVFSLMNNHAIEKGDDERRLFYVAVTRARHSVTISYAEQGIDGRDQIGCEFIQEIDPQLIEVVDTHPHEDGYAKNIEMLLQPAEKCGVDIKNKEFVRELFLERGLSVTALNNYLECPWNYFYTNLLRIPKAKSNHQMYGTAIHAALKDFFEKQKTDPANKEFLLERFALYAQKEPFAEAELAKIIEKGNKTLGGYYDHYHQDWHTNVFPEFSIRGLELTPEIRLTGAIDKMEIGRDGREVVVVDYKTGKPKTRNDIEGLTKTSRGNIKRQLVFYNLLLNKFADGKYQMTAGDIDFVEPDDRGNYRKERFLITPEEVTALEQQIHAVSQEILNLDFWDRRCDDRDCHYCGLREMV